MCGWKASTTINFSAFLEAQLFEIKASSVQETFQIAPDALGHDTVLTAGDNWNSLEEIVVVAREQLKLCWKASAMRKKKKKSSTNISQTSSHKVKIQNMPPFLLVWLDKESPTQMGMVAF